MGEFITTCSLVKPNVIGITETWFNKSSSVKINGYEMYRKDRSDGRKGGIVYR